MTDPDQPPWPTQPPDQAAENPFAAPRAQVGPGGLAGDPAPSRGLVRHVMPVAILMIIQGALETMFAILVLTAAVVLPRVLADVDNEQAPAGVRWLMMIAYGVMGAGGLLAGILHLAGGISGLMFRRRMLGVVALAAGMASIFTCYCGPTAIALGIYGLITYLNPAVISAFALGDAGVPAAEIRARYGN